MSPYPCRPRPLVAAAALLLLSATATFAAPSAASPQQTAAPAPESLSKRADAAASVPSVRGTQGGRVGTRPFLPGRIYTVRGAYAGFNAAANTIQMEVPGVLPLTGLLTSQSALSHGGAPAAINAFVPGEWVTARLLMRPWNPLAAPHADAVVLSLSDTPDAASPLPVPSGSRTQIVAGAVAANTGAWLDVRVPIGPPETAPSPIRTIETADTAAPRALIPTPAPGPAQIERFRLTARTLFYRNGRLTSAAAYPPGSPVAVKPRSLPRGERLAVIVAEDAALAAAYYRDGLTVWRGRIAAVSTVAGTLLLARDDGAQRTVSVDALTVIHKQRRSVNLAALAAGDQVSVHLRKGAIVPPGYRVASQVTVSTSSSSRTAPAAAAAAVTDGE